MLNSGLKLVAHRFDGYWKDVGTIQSLWEANMELLDDNAGFSLSGDDWRIYSKNPVKPPHYIGPEAKLRGCYVTEGCEICGEIDHSVIFEGVTVEEGAKSKIPLYSPVQLSKRVRLFISRSSEQARLSARMHALARLTILQMLTG